MEPDHVKKLGQDRPRLAVKGKLPPSLASVDLTALLVDPQQLAEIPPEAVPGILGDVERLRAALWARMMGASGNSQPERPAEDRLLTVEEAARRLGTSEDYLYRNAKRLPFTVRLGPRQLRFSAQGLAGYIRRRQGR